LSDGPEWFAPKRYGYGTGVPISWQGWALTIGSIALTIFLGLRFKNQPMQLIAALTPLVIAFVVIAARTTRGALRWRWGDDD
jgi:tetrahydromethanopterin S-methyltransferase subunit C